MNKLLQMLSALLLGCVALLCCKRAEAAFAYRQSITVDRTKVGLTGTTTITHFPMLVDITDADLKSVADYSGDVQSNSGHDIVFRANDTTTCGGAASCTLSHELITYTRSTGRVLAWVRLPSVNAVSAASNTVFYVYYGDASITASTQRKTDVWRSYEAVWHLDEDPSGTAPQLQDSTSNARNGTTAGSMLTAQSVTGKISKAVNWDGTDDRASTSNFLSGLSALSVEAWVQSTEDSPNDYIIVGKSNTNTVASLDYIFSVGVDNTIGANGVITKIGAGGDDPVDQKCSTTTQDTLVHVVVTFNGTAVRVYLNGVLDTACNYDVATPGTLNTSTTPVTLGGLTSTGTGFTMGWTDEVRISNVVRNASWAKASYNNQNSPTTFYTAIGAEDAVTVGEFGVEFLGGRAVTLPNGQVLLGWETGLEQDNLGFQVLREQDGVFSQLTQDLIGGSLLRAMVGGNGSSPYFWLDSAGWGAGRVRYFVEDVDAYGKATRHGPFEPTSPSAANAALRTAWAAQQQPEPMLASQPQSFAADAGLDFAPVARAMEFAPLQGPALIKVGVIRAGWQRVTGAELAAQGFPLGIPAHQVAVLKDGANIARFIAEGGDGTLDAEDTLEFWGLGEPGIYANESVYTVSWEGPLGRSVQHSTQAPPAMSALGPGGFSTFGEYAEKKFFLAALNNGPADNFLGPVIRPSSLTVPLSAPDALGATEARLLVNLQGTSLLPHQVEVAWNGVTLGSVDFANREAATFESALSEIYADNTLALTSKAGPYDYSAIVNARVFYQRAYKANNDQLRFTALGGDRVTLSAFTQPGIRILDVTNPGAPLELSVLEFGSVGDLSGKITVPGAGTRELYAFTPNAMASPSYLKRYKSSAMKSAGPVDLVILSHAAFIDRLAPLVAQREREGLRVVVDDVEAIYDDFGRGRKDPEAIREALRWLAAQGKPAKYLLLIGDGSFDPHNYLGKNVVDFLPVPTINTPAFETAYDDFYGDLDEDGKPEIAVGRLPVRTPGDLDIAIEKLLRYALGPSEWPLDVLLVSGEDPLIDVAKIGRDGLEGEPLSVFEQPLMSTTPKAELLQSLAEPSSRLVTYIGHGSTQVWGNGSAFATSDALTLERTGQSSVFTLLTCLNGFFHDIYSESVAEGLLRAPNGAAVSVWAAPAMAQSEELRLLYRAFISEWTSGRVHTLGELVVAAKRKVVASDTERMMALLGDPSLRLVLPEIAQTRSDALAEANKPPPVLPHDPPPVPTGTEKAPGVPHATRGVLTASDARALRSSRGLHTNGAAPSGTSAVPPSSGTDSAPAANGASSPQALEHNSCALSAGASAKSQWGVLLMVGLLGLALRRRSGADSR